MVLLIVKLIVLRLLPDLLVDVLLGLLLLLLPTATVLHRSTDSDQEGWRNAVTERFRCHFKTHVKKEKWTGKE